MCFPYQQYEASSRVTISFDKKELSRATHKIAEQTGYKIVMAGGSSIHFKASGDFMDVDIFECLNTILNNEDRSISFNAHLKQITIYKPGISTSGSHDSRKKIGLGIIDRTSIDYGEGLVVKPISFDDNGEFGRTLAKCQQPLKDSSMGPQAGDELIHPDDSDKDRITVMEFQQVMNANEVEMSSEDGLIPHED